jgi:hypothetical protein
MVDQVCEDRLDQTLLDFQQLFVEPQYTSIATVCSCVIIFDIQLTT